MSYRQNDISINVGADLRVCPNNEGEHMGSPLHGNIHSSDVFDEWGQSRDDWFNAQYMAMPLN